ncbi:hypothetical protein K458DRAFT_303847 [Lentithecium fluviatile CBS 122367]|uniref:DUF7082 domain-containing protein n=1 Tax=Lentithecium fluviatile CBS 122367 TaxID=1168545 RepID=A0A6G1J0H5_9PLEO|nr:hypothetical protein K458DRAFT_303847 [Lentithecium fluviatile CBS 122367]
MSGYDKNQQHYAYDAEATRPNQVPTYAGIAQPSFASQYTDAPARLSHEPSNVEMPFIPSSTYESRATGGYQAESSFIDARSRHPASHIVTESEITKYVTPSQGTAGSTVLLHIRAKHDLAAEHPTFVFMFGNKKCVAALQKVDHDDEFYNYALSVEVPPFPLTNSWNPTMMLKLQMEDKNGRFLNEIDAGKFTFTDMSPNLAYQSAPEVVRKRKYSSEFEGQEYAENTSKRTNSMRFQAKPRSMSTAYSAPSLSPLPAQSSLSTTYGYGSGYDMTKQTSYTPQLSQKSLYAVPSGMNISQTDMKPPPVSPNMQTYGQYGSVGQSGRVPVSMATTPSRSTGLPSPANTVLPTPVLVRATTLPQSGVVSSGQPFNPYTMYPTKAVLKIEGDLDAMTNGWTEEEREGNRRLVEFKRSQHGSTISTSFAPVTPEARAARSICVSCIWWEEKDEYYITSVDTIFLLEQLVNVRFTVEEKNRIRRNLEGFRPLTVSKAKSDSEEFFKVIMGFPNPKPRNIEKDVKVFPWKILSHALKKIISKYSASYASTAGAGSLPVGSSSSYVQVGISQTAGDAHRNSSPRSVASSAASTAYTPSMTSTSLSPNPKPSAGLEGSAGHGLSVSQRGPSGQGLTQWGATAHHQVPQYTAGLPQGGREAWDYGYLSANAAPGVPAATQSMHMQRSDVTPNLGQLPADNSYQQYGQRTTRV